MIDNKLFVENSPQLYNVGKQIAEAYKAEITNAHAVGTGELQHFRWDVMHDKNSIKLVYYLPKQWYWIEYGRQQTQRKGDGSVYKAIHNWILDKGIQCKVRYDKNGRKYIPTQKQLAFLITRKIHQDGYFSPNHQGKHLLQKSLDNTTALKDKFADIATQMVGKQVLMEVMAVLR